MYYVLGPDRNTYGPADENVLKSWFAGKRIEPQTLICELGETQWSPLEAHSQLMGMLNDASRDSGKAVPLPLPRSVPPPLPLPRDSRQEHLGVIGSSPPPLPVAPASSHQKQTALEPAAPSLPLKVPQRPALTKAFTQWMKANKFRVGIVPEDLDLSKAKGDAKLLVGAMKALLGAEGLFLVSGGSNFNKIVQATAPLLPLADIVGVRYDLWKGQQLVLVVFGDEVPAARIVERFATYLELAEPLSECGLRINFQTTAFEIYPLIVYLDSSHYRQALPEIMRAGWKRAFWKKIMLRAIAVDVPGQQVTLAEVPGVAGKISDFAQRHGWGTAFSINDLKTILILADSTEPPAAATTSTSASRP